MKLSYEEYKERGILKEPTKGTLEMMAQIQEIVYCSERAGDPGVLEEPSMDLPRGWRPPPHISSSRASMGRRRGRR